MQCSLWGLKAIYGRLSGAALIGRNVLRTHRTAVMMKFPKAGPGILRELWGKLLEERFWPPPKHKGE